MGGVVPVEKCNAFTDLNQTNSELQSYIIQACNLGLMGYYSNGIDAKPAFDPNTTITLAEIATTISRLFRGEQHKGTEKRWYQNHLLTLQKIGIIPPHLDPFQKETRQTVYEILRNIENMV
jgi:hypothetical protein